MSRCHRHRLKVHIISASGLRAADIGCLSAGKSDPFCRAHVHGRPDTRIQTEHLKKTLDPEWNEAAVLEGVKTGDAIEFEVFDHDMIGSPDLLGRCEIPFSTYYPNGYAGNVLLEKTDKATSRLNIKIEVLPPQPGHISDTRCYVKLVDAHGLRAADIGLIGAGKSDPYVVVNIPGKPRSKFQSKVLWKTLDPYWDEEDELIGYAEGDPIHIEVFDYDLIGAPDSLGQATLQSEDFHPYGYTGPVMLQGAGRTTGQALVNVEIDVEVPLPPPEPVDPLAHVTIAEIQRVPFQLRSLETNKTHKLVGYTQIGRSKRLLDPERDLIMSQVSGDIGRLHAHIKASLLPDQVTWLIRVYDHNGGGGLGQAEGGGHAGTGTSVDGEPVHPKIGHHIQPGSIIRFGKQEFWTVECAALLSKSERAGAAQTRALILEDGNDPSCMRELHIPSIACHDALQACKDWISVIRVTLEWLNEPDEPPCVDLIEVLDELRRTASVHTVASFEEQQAYQVKKILRDVRLGTTLRLRLCSDPFMLAPVLGHLEGINKWLAEMAETHVHT